MLVYVAIGPVDKDAWRFLSRTIVDRFWAACDMLAWVDEPLVCMGVTAPVSIAELCMFGVEEPLLSWVANTDASLRAASATICFIVLLRR